MYHYIYKITLLLGSLAGKYYYGKRSKNIIPENDAYAGSGRIVKDYFKKYGKIRGVTYEKEIIELNPDKYTNAAREREIIEPHLGNPMCINIAKGGFGGGNPGHVVSEETKKLISEKLVGNPNLITKGFEGKHHSEETKKKLSENHKGLTHTMPLESRIKVSERMKGTIVPEETRKKISDALIGNICWNKLTGAKSQYIKQIDKNGHTVKIWDLNTECLVNHGYRLSHIKSCCNGERKTHKKCFWEWYYSA